MLENLRNRASSESGFTLIELLVVMLILGILAAIAVPSFLSQRDKANDAEAKAAVRTAQTAAETYGSDNNNDFTGMVEADLIAIEPTLGDAPSAVGVTNAADGTYTVTVTSSTNSTFDIARTGGTTAQTCAPINTGGCGDGTW